MGTKKDLNPGQYSLLNHLKENAEEVKGTIATIITQANIAQELNRSKRTVYRQMKTLEEKGYIERAVKRGEEGGTVVVFKKGEVNFTSHPDNPITGTTPTAEEIRDKVFPNKGTYQKDTRTPEQKARDRVLKERATDENTRVNFKLSQQPYPTKEVFEMTEDPEKNYRAYLLSRLYNVLLLSHVEEWRNKVYQTDNERAQRIADRYKKRYYHYDILREEFMGTRAFEDFKKLDELIQEGGYDPYQFMAPNFEYMMQLIQNGQQGNPPYTNTLYSTVAEANYRSKKKWKNTFEDVHPYYKQTHNEVRLQVSRNPIIGLILTAYEQPLEDIYSPTQTIEEKQRMRAMPSPKQLVLNAYRKDIQAQIEKAGISEEAKVTTLKFVDKNLAPQYIQQTLEGHILHEVVKIKNDPRLEWEEQGTQAYYTLIGNWENKEDLTEAELYNCFKQGVAIDYAVNGGHTFYATIRTIQDVGGQALPYAEIKEGIEELEGLIPLTAGGNIEVEQLYEEVFAEELDQPHPMKGFMKEMEEEDKKVYGESIYEAMQNDKGYKFDIP